MGLLSKVSYSLDLQLFLALFKDKFTYVSQISKITTIDIRYRETSSPTIHSLTHKLVCAKDWIFYQLDTT